MSRTAAEIKTELDEVTRSSNSLDQQITRLRGIQADLNAKRKVLEVEFQRQHALEEQAKLAGS